MDKFVGIDLGTTFSVVAYIDENGQPKAIPNENGRVITPSVVYLGEDEPIVGDEAKEQQAFGEMEVASFFKRSMGDPHFELMFHGKTYTPVDLSALVLKHLKQMAENYLGQPVTHAVITVPAYFHNMQREATIEAGRRAGLEVLSIINEPTAAAFAYGIRPSQSTQTILVYDLGGGTFDVSVVEVSPTTQRVLGTDGDHNLGGKDWDDRIFTYLAQKFEEEFGVEPVEDDFNELLVKAEQSKISLSQRESVDVVIQAAGHKGSYPLSRDQFESLTSDLMERTQRLTEQVLEDINLTWDDLTHILLVGGSTRMPMVREYVQRMSGKPPLTTVNPDEAVALGAAIQAAMEIEERGASKVPMYALTGRKKSVDVMSHSLGMIAVSEDRSRYINTIILQKNQPIPINNTQPYQLPLRRWSDNTLEVFVTQGETENPLDCVYLGKYVFSDIPALSDQTAVLDITYAYDKNGVVNVAAVERSTKRPLTLTIEPLPDDIPGRFVLPPNATGIPEAYNAHQGQQEIKGALKDRFGNALGSQYDLAKDNAFEGAQVAVLQLYTGEGFNFKLPTNALKEKGFEVHRWVTVPGIQEFRNVLERSCQLWLISSNSQLLSREHIQEIKKFFEEGKGFYIWGDNEPYYADANVLAKTLFGVEMRGDVWGDKTVNVRSGNNRVGLTPHLITTGIERLYEGITIATIQKNSELTPLIYGSAGNLIAALYDKDGKRAIIDGGFTRLFVKWDTAGTARYVKNAAGWLANYERWGDKLFAK